MRLCITLLLKKLSDLLKSEITKNIENIKFNGDPVKGYPGCLNFSFGCIEGEGLMVQMNSMAFSSGSACTSVSLEPSYVLRALGIGDDLAHCSARFGISRFTTQAEIVMLLSELKKAVVKLREMR